MPQGTGKDITCLQRFMAVQASQILLDIFVLWGARILLIVLILLIQVSSLKAGYQSGQEHMCFSHEAGAFVLPRLRGVFSRIICTCIFA